MSTLTSTVETKPRSTHALLGSTLSDRYRIDSFCAAGGMGSVFIGTHLELGHRVAIKMLHPHLAEDAAASKRFVHEARVCAGLHHPNIVTTIDFGRAKDGTPFIVMEYLVGETLSSLMQKRGPLPLGVALGLCRQLLTGLAAIHDAGIVHRDIKPSNIFLVRTTGTQFHVKLVDFGVAKTASIDVTRDGSFVGTPAYMSPEALFGASDYSVSADLYAVGLVIHKMIDGRLPFESTDPSLMARAKLAGHLRLFANVGEDLPEAFRRLVEALLQEMPHDRPQSAYAVLEEVAAIERAWRKNSTARWSVTAEGSDSDEDDTGMRELTAFMETVMHGSKESDVVALDVSAWASTVTEQAKTKLLSRREELPTTHAERAVQPDPQPTSKTKRSWRMKWPVTIGSVVLAFACLWFLFLWRSTPDEPVVSEGNEVVPFSLGQPTIVSDVVANDAPAVDEVLPAASSEEMLDLRAREPETTPETTIVDSKPAPIGERASRKPARKQARQPKRVPHRKKPVKGEPASSPKLELRRSL